MKYLLIILSLITTVICFTKLPSIKLQKSALIIKLSSQISQRTISTRITKLYDGYARNWFDDDLPNILGINPLEAAVIFGFLYYLYGPEALYGYAREAGKLFRLVVISYNLLIFYELIFISFSYIVHMLQLLKI